MWPISLFRGRGRSHSGRAPSTRRHRSSLRLSIEALEDRAVPTAATAVPQLSISDVSAKEGNKGVTQFNFTVTLSSPSALPVSVSYATAPGSAVPGWSCFNDGLDYVSTAGTLTF